MEQFDAYGHAILSVAIYALLAQVLNALTGVRKGGAGHEPGQPFQADYNDLNYRIERAYMNSIELMGIYAAITFAAILAGASPFWVNLLATLVLIFRLVYTFCYFRGIGPAYQGIRTMLAVASAAAFFIMGIMTLVAVF